MIGMLGFMSNQTHPIGPKLALDEHARCIMVGKISKLYHSIKGSISISVVNEYIYFLKILFSF